MQSTMSSQLRRTTLGLCFAIAFPGCALLVPPSWRSQIDIPLYGPLDGRSRSPQALDTAPLDPAERQRRRQQLAQAIARDRRDLKNLVADPGASDRSPADDPELRRIVERLPELQRQLRAMDPTPTDDAWHAPVPQ
jgi:hypothetical protein